MKLSLKDILAIAVMVAAVPVVMDARERFSPSDLDKMSRTGGILVYRSPLQTELPISEFTFRSAGATLVPVAVFDVKGVVLSRKRYLPWGDYNFAPWDIALGWGPLSNPTLLSEISFWQGGRQLYCECSNNTVTRRIAISETSANLRIIAANDIVREKIDRIRPGNVIRMSGFLVDVIEGVEVTRTSRSRDDQGETSSEILYLQAVDL